MLERKVSEQQREEVLQTAARQATARLEAAAKARAADADAWELDADVAHGYARAKLELDAGGSSGSARVWHVEAPWHANRAQECAQ